MAPVIERGKRYQIEDLGGRLRRLTIYNRPNHYQDAEGQYQPIDSGWVDSGDGALPNAVTAAPLPVSIANDGKRRIYLAAGKYIEIGAPHILIGGVWTRVSLGAPVRNGNRLRWTTANADVIIDHGGHMIKMGILLKDPDADGVPWQPSQGRFAFPVDLVGLTRQGTDILADGVVVGKLTPPHIEDLDDPRKHKPIASTFVRVSGQDYIHFQLPDITGWTRPLVDPTITLQPDGTAGLDNWIQSNSPTVNNGTSALWAVGESNADAIIYRQLIQFDLTSLPDNAVISSATLSLYATIDQSANNRTFRVYRVKVAWTELGSTWNSRDGTNNWQTAGCSGANDREVTDIGSRAFGATETPNEFKDFVLTPTSKAALDLGFGWIIIADTENNDAHIGASSDDSTAANRPKLVIVYTVPQTIQPGRIESTAQVFTPSLVHTIKPARIESTAQFFTAVLRHTVKPARIESTVQFFTPVLIKAYTIRPARIESTVVVHTPSIMRDVPALPVRLFVWDRPQTKLVIWDDLR